MRARVESHSSAEGNPVISSAQEVSLEKLRPWPGNPRSIKPQRLEQLQRALEADPEMLWARPLIALPDGTVICGNQRLLAARGLGWKAAPVVSVDLDEKRARLWALRDNNTYGDWDEPALAELLAELQVEGIELALTGFSGGEIDRILAGIPTLANPDDAPDLPTGNPESQPGEIYELGLHRLACGDARDRDLMQRLIGFEPPKLFWTDPPYGVDYVGKTSRALTIENDNGDAAALLVQVLETVDELLADSAPFYVCCPAGPTGTGFRQALGQAGWRHHQTLVWVKNSLVVGHSDYHYAHEEVLYGWRPGPGRPGRGRHTGSRWQGGNDQSSVFMVDRPARSESHPTMKPVALITAMLTNSSRRGDVVLDPFAGSGSTLIACEQLGRRCFAVEVDTAYCDVIRRRYQEYRDGR
jgi:DNA modification methylase